MAKPKIVEDAELEWLLKVTRKTSGLNAARNEAMLLTLFGTGMMPGEIAQLTVADALTKTGRWRSGESPGRGEASLDAQVRAEISFNGRARPLYWANKRLTASLDTYLAERSRLGLGTLGKAAYRGLDPDSPLFLARGKGFTYRETVKDGKPYRQYASVSNLFSKLFQKAGVEGAVSGSARRTMAVKLYRKGTDPRVIAEILGNVSITSVKKMVEGDTRKLGDIVADVI